MDEIKKILREQMELFDQEWGEISSMLFMFRKYHEKIEGLLFNEIRSHREKLMELRVKSTEERTGNFINIFNMEPDEFKIIGEMRLIESEFLQELRKNSFISLYTFFLSTILELSNSLAKQYKSELNKGKSLSIIKENLKLLDFKFNLGSHKHWPALKNYNKMRNYVIHEDNFIPKNQKKLLEYLSKNDCLSESNRIVLTQAYCIEAINVIDAFLLDFFLAYRQEVSIPNPFEKIM